MDWGSNSEAWYRVINYLGTLFVQVKVINIFIFDPKGSTQVYFWIIKKLSNEKFEKS